MGKNPAENDFEPANFSPGFLDHGGPYYLSVGEEAVPRTIGLRILPHHINYQNVAHGGVLTTLADVALSHAVYNALRPHPNVATISLNTNFLRAVKLDDWLECDVTLERLGGRTAYTSGRIRRGQEVVATMSGVFSLQRN